MGTILSAITGIAAFAKIIETLKTIKKGVDEGEKGALKYYSKLGGAVSGDDSYISFTKPFVVNPLVMVDESIQHDDGLPVILSTANMVFASFYTLALKADSVIGNVTVRKKLDKFNPERDMSSLSLEGLEISSESFSSGLPDVSKGVVYSNEAYDPIMNTGSNDRVPGRMTQEEKDDYKFNRQLKKDLEEDEEKDKRKNAKSTDVKDVQMKENKNLFLGRTYSVSIVENDTEVNVDVIIRLMTAVIDQESLAHLLSMGKYAFSGTDRLKRVLTGSLSALDLLLCRDILDAHRKALKNDKSGIYREITKRGINNQLASRISKSPSIGTNSGIAVISEETLREIEFTIGDKLEKPSVRDRLFAALNLMLLFVYDPKYGVVTMYQRGLAYNSESTIKEMKGGMDKADKGTDVTDLFKRIAAGDKLF